VSDKRKRAARVIMAETGMKYTAALREADRRHALAQAVAVPASLPSVAVPEAAGGFLASMLAPTSEPGPPYVHTFSHEEPIGWDEDGDPVYPEPGPAITVTENP
jgi:hypothetical protein